MNLERYPYLAKNDFQDYEFYSEGPNGRIKKVVRFTKVVDNGLTFYNLGFGDVSSGNDFVDDKSVSNNNDRDKILATVAKTIIDFTDIHGNYYVFATGSTPVRTRLYQMGISTLWEQINLDFEVLGFKDDQWHSFKRDVNYEAFLVKRK